MNEAEKRSTERIRSSGDALRATLSEGQGQVRECAKLLYATRLERLFLVASGASLAALYPGKYILDKYSALASDLYCGPEFLDRAPLALREGSWVILNSSSGSTEDALRALDLAKEKGAGTLALTGDDRSVLAEQADEVLVYPVKHMLSPLLEVYLLIVSLLMLRQEFPQSAAFHEGLARLADDVDRVTGESAERSAALAAQHSRQQGFYCLAGGPLYSLAYLFSLCILMENLKLHSGAIHVGEFRHGALEIVRQGSPCVLFLLGEDETRKAGERALRFCNRFGAETLCFDTRDYGAFHPLFSPFILWTPLAWFAHHLALRKGIDPFERLYMGKVAY